MWDCASKNFDVLFAAFVSKMKCTLDGFFVDMFAQAYPLGETWSGNENDKNNKDHNIFPPKRTSSTEQFINLYEIMSKVGPDGSLADGGF